MIIRWLQTALNLLVYFCAATLLSLVIILAYLWSTWQLDREKLIQMLAIAQGIDLFAAQKQAESEQEELVPEQLSYQDWVNKRATMFRDLELRRLALNNALAQLKLQQRQLAEEQTTNKQLIEDFEARLLALTQGAEAEGREEVRSMLEGMKPSQAKTQILKMLEDDEIDAVILLLSDMQQTKRAKILSEFKTDDENEKVAEVLRLIREGEPVASMADDARGKLQKPSPTGT